jgi:hypothetical protein
VTENGVSVDAEALSRRLWKAVVAATPPGTEPTFLLPADDEDDEERRAWEKAVWQEIDEVADASLGETFCDDAGSVPGDPIGETPPTAQQGERH